jgi:hypothetical protein
MLKLAGLRRGKNASVLMPAWVTPMRPLSPSTRAAQLPVGKGMSKPSFASACRTNWKRSYCESVIGPV